MYARGQGEEKEGQTDRCEACGAERSVVRRVESDPGEMGLKELGFGDGSIRPPLAELDPRHEEQVLTAMKNADLI